MKNLVLIILLGLALSYCSTAKISMTDANGTCEGSYTTFFKSAEGININACNAHGDAQNTGTNTDLVQSLLKLLVK